MIPEIRGTWEKTGGTIKFPMRARASEKELKVFTERLRKLEGYRDFSVSEDGTRTAPAGGDIPFVFADGPEGKQGAYELEISPEKIVITSHDGEGKANALTTLYAMIRDRDGILDCGLIRDEPKYVHRGFMLDCSRHFFSPEIVRRMIEEAAQCKMNRLHWHISDDQGYRLESRAFPGLNELASFRDDPECGEHYGGFYTFGEVRDIVAFARERGMEVIPEIDMPGHISALLRAYPELSCSGEALETISEAGIFDRILCAGNDGVFVYLRRLLDEVCELFPYEEFHIGGDEVPKGEWKKCPRCQARIRQLGLRDEEDLQAWFTNRVADYLISKGKRPVCWNEALRSDQLDERVRIQFWEQEQGEAGRYCAERLSRNYQWIYSFTHAFYFDFDPPLCPMRKMAQVDNSIRSGEIIPDDKLRGYECTLWSEWILTEERLHHLSFPRMFAVAEAAWNGSLQYDAFLKRCEREVDWARKDGIKALSVEDADPSTEKIKTVLLREWREKSSKMREMVMPNPEALAGTIRYKLTGCIPEEDIEDLIRSIRE